MTATNYDDLQDRAVVSTTITNYDLKDSGQLKTNYDLKDSGQLKTNYDLEDWAVENKL